MNRRIPVCCFIFDLDGTLVYYKGGVLEFLDKIVINTLQDLNLALPDKKERLKLWDGKISSNDVLRSWEISNLDEFWRTFDNYQLPAVEDGIKNGEILLYDDVLPTLQKLKKEEFVIAVVTNTPPDITEVKLKGLGIRDFFSCVVALGTEMQELAKPSPYGILKCIKKLGFSPKEVAYVGDSQFDILAAKNAGCYSVLINREGRVLEEKPDFEIVDLNDLLSTFKKCERY